MFLLAGFHNTEKTIIDLHTQLFVDKYEHSYLHSGILGLKNICYSCFINSVLQCLSHTLEITDVFLTLEFKMELSLSRYRVGDTQRQAYIFL